MKREYTKKAVIILFALLIATPVHAAVLSPYQNYGGSYLNTIRQTGNTSPLISELQRGGLIDTHITLVLRRDDSPTPLEEQVRLNAEIRAEGQREIDRLESQLAQLRSSSARPEAMSAGTEYIEEALSYYDGLLMCTHELGVGADYDPAKGGCHCSTGYQKTGTACLRPTESNWFDVLDDQFNDRILPVMRRDFPVVTNTQITDAFSVLLNDRSDRTIEQVYSTDIRPTLLAYYPTPTPTPKPISAINISTPTKTLTISLASATWSPEPSPSPTSTVVPIEEPRQSFFERFVSFLSKLDFWN